MRIISLLTLDIFRLSIGWALESLGHDVYHLNVVTEERLEDAIQLHQPDFFFDMGWDFEHCFPEKIEMLRTILKRHGVYHVYFAEEDSLHFDRWSKHYVTMMQPDFVLTRGAECVERYRQLGIPSEYLDVGCNPDFHRPVPPDPELICDVSVICNGQFVWDIYRRNSIENLVLPLFESEYNVQIWGRDWETAEQYFGIGPRPGSHKGYLDFHRTPYAFNSAKINVSVQSMDDQLSNRTLDIMASGGFLLTSDSTAVRTKLIPGVNCVVSNSPDQTLELIQYYLTHEEERKQIAYRGMLHAREHLSYQVTLPPVLECIRQDISSKRGVAL